MSPVALEKEVTTHVLYGGAVEIEFRPDNKSRRYKVIKKDGEYLEKATYPSSVTQITGCFDKSTQLLIWAERLTNEYVKEVIGENQMWESQEVTDLVASAASQYKAIKDKAADIGDIVHSFAEAYANWQLALGEKPRVEQWPEEAMNGINGFLDAVKHHNIKFVQVEKVVYSPTLDIVGKYDTLAFVDGELTLIDYKSSKDCYAPMVAQVAAYLTMHNAEAEEKVTRAAIFHFSKSDGSFRYIPFTEQALSFGEAFFNSMYTAFKANKELEKYLKGE